MKKSSELTDEIELLKTKLPGEIYEPNVKLTKFQKQLIESTPLLNYYKKLYTDFALEKLLDNFAESQFYEIEKEPNYL